MTYDFDALLDRVEKPARYTGGEMNAEVKPISQAEISFAFCFPDTYEVAMSHLGMKILYGILNELPYAVCERVCMPWVDMLCELRKNNIPLCSLESHTPLSRFDIIGFTLQYEMSYTNVLEMMDLGGVPVLSSERGEDDPVLVPGTAGPERVPQERERLVLMTPAPVVVLAIHDLGLDRVQLQPDLSQPVRDRRLYLLSLPQRGRVHDHVIDIPFEADAGELPGHPRIERVMQKQVGQDRRHGRPLRGPPIPGLRDPIGPDQWCPQPTGDIQHHPRRWGVCSHRLEQQLMIDAVEERPDVHIEHPVPFPTARPGHRHRVQRRTPGTVPVGVVMEDRLHDPLQTVGHHRLRDPVRDSGHPEHPHPTTGLRDRDSTNRRREVGPRTHPIPNPVQVEAYSAS